MNILITGIHGFVGTNLVQALKAEHRIYGLDIVTPNKEGIVKTYTWNEIPNLPSIDAVIHLAGKAHDTKNQTDSQVYFDINTGLTQKIYDWFLGTNAKKFIFFSSVKAAADKVVGEFLTEEHVPTPVGPYGESKIAAEKYILSRQSVVCSRESLLPTTYGACDIPPLRDYPLPSTHYPLKSTYILRPCMIHGPGNKGNLNLLYQVVKKGIPYPLGAFENKRSFCSIDNMCFVISQLIEKDIESSIYNVCDDEALSTNELIALISSTLNKPNRTWKWNKKLIEFIARIGSLLHLPLNTERLQKLTENYVVSNKKIKNALELDKMPVRAEEGLIKTFNSFVN